MKPPLWSTDPETELARQRRNEDAATPYGDGCATILGCLFDIIVLVAILGGLAYFLRSIV